MPPLVLPHHLSGRVAQWTKWLSRFTAVGGFIFCIRFCIGAFFNNGPFPFTLLIIFIGYTSFYFWKPKVALIGFLISAPLLIGLNRSLLLSGPAAVSLAFSGLMVGMLLRAVLKTGHQQRIQSFDSSDLLLTVVLASVQVSALIQFTSKCWDAGFHWFTIFSPEYGFGSQYYFLTSAFLWTQGLLTFSWCRSPDFYSSLTISLKAYGWILLLFFGLQWFWDLPEGLMGFGRIGLEDLVLVKQFSAPFEDIHSFGAVAVTIWALILSTCLIQRRASMANVCLLAGTLIACVVSWSRITWIVLVISISWMLLRYASRRAVGIAVFAFIAVVTIVYLRSPSWSSSKNPYLWRISTFSHFANAPTYDRSRSGLYYKAGKMIADRPLLGSGLGGFYNKSVHFARPDDPEGGQPNFAHNVILQFAAEMGIPLTLMLIAGVALPLFRYRHLKDGSEALPLPALSLAIFSYLMTQMTANSLNVYLSNQLFFWTLFACAAASMDRCRVEAISKRSKTGSTTAIVH